VSTHRADEMELLKCIKRSAPHCNCMLKNVAGQVQLPHETPISHIVIFLISEFISATTFLNFSVHNFFRVPLSRGRPMRLLRSCGFPCRIMPKWQAKTGKSPVAHPIRNFIPPAGRSYSHVGRKRPEPNGTSVVRLTDK